MNFLIIYGICSIAALLISSSSSTSFEQGEKDDANNIDKNVYLAYLLSNLNDPKYLTLEIHQKLPILIKLYEKLDMDAKKEKKKSMKWRFG